MRRARRSSRRPRHAPPRAIPSSRRYHPSSERPARWRRRIARAARARVEDIAPQSPGHRASPVDPPDPARELPHAHHPRNHPLGAARSPADPARARPARRGPARTRAGSAVGTYGVDSGHSDVCGLPMPVPPKSAVYEHSVRKEMPMPITRLALLTALAVGSAPGLTRRRFANGCSRASPRRSKGPRRCRREPPT